MVGGREGFVQPLEGERGVVGHPLLAGALAPGDGPADVDCRPAEGLGLALGLGCGWRWGVVVGARARDLGVWGRYGPELL